jgi:2-keto-4-pentenoate hydratase/2-oxohepta-3-ene-1,7-dioic acid hydratase in catechol pathway
LELPSGKAAETYDFEGEIVAVIGKSGRFISKDDALKHVIGYSIMNEGSVRGWMKHSVHAGKNFHSSGSWGPWITTVDEIDDFSSLKLETHVNGKLMQSAFAGEMIFSLSELIAYISNLLPLNPGDIIATGSPNGTGGSRNPTAFLNSGDCVEVSVDRIGTLKNYVGP